MAIGRLLYMELGTWKEEATLPLYIMLFDVNKNYEEAIDSPWDAHANIYICQKIAKVFDTLDLNCFLPQWTKMERATKSKSLRYLRCCGFDIDHATFQKYLANLIHSHFELIMALVMARAITRTSIMNWLKRHMEKWWGCIRIYV